MAREIGIMGNVTSAFRLPRLPPDPGKWSRHSVCSWPDRLMPIRSRHESTSYTRHLTWMKSSILTGAQNTHVVADTVEPGSPSGAGAGGEHDGGVEEVAALLSATRRRTGG